jgi:protein O-mannosyl-transferase
MKPKPATRPLATPVGQTVGRQGPWLTLLVSGALAAVTLTLYSPVGRCEFISFDDPVYVTENVHVRAGLSWDGAAWAFGTLHGEQTYWHPVTWISHMLDCQLFDANPAAHHWVNLLFHTLNAVLVLLVFRKLTRAFWRCVVLAGLFALHPLQVETVAWVAERKNLLSAMFWLLTMWAYCLYVERSKVHGQPSGLRSPESGDHTPQVDQARSHRTRPVSRSTFGLPPRLPSLWWYGLALVLFTLGLMCKPVLITLPFVLLLLDYWPLDRLPLRSPGFKTQHSRLKTFLVLLGEKLPFLALAAASSVIAILGHRGLGILATASELPLALRLQNAVVCYAHYLGKVIWPSGLAIFYPYAGSWPLWEVILCAAVLLGLTVLAIRIRRRDPSLLLGWLWFVGVLVPFIGLIQGGAQAMADRFVYLPLLGVLVAAVWVASEFGGRGAVRLAALPAAATVALTLCFILARKQIGYWQNSETLFRHALQVTRDNFLAYDALGTYYAEHDRPAEGIDSLRKSLAIRRRFEPMHNLALALASQGGYAEAIPLYQQALRLRPKEINARKNLAYALVQNGQAEPACAEYRLILQTAPGDLEARNALGIALTLAQNLDQAIAEFREVLRADPNQAGAHGNLAHALMLQHNFAEAATHYREVLRVMPDDARAHVGLGAALAESGKRDEAARQFAEALRLKPDYAEARRQLEALQEKP